VEHRVCGLLQLLVLAGLALGGVLLADIDVDWVGPTQGLGELYVRILVALRCSCTPSGSEWCC
jgi:hypothetical protein